jgi:hypothetical protein
MKRILTILAVAVSLVLTASVKNTAAAQVGVGVQISYQDFYDELSPHGRWMEYPDYGYVWMPNAGPDFRPYSTNGHWVWSDDYEWIWVSDYSWGWAPFHYGRWFQDPMYGWMWMPGYEWAPAWVAWRDGGDYYGWAPLRPGINIGINFSIGSYNPPVEYWCFAPRRYISSPRIYNYCLPSRQNVTIINNTTIINNYSRRTNNIFVTGPRRGDAERYAGHIRSVRFREVNSPGRARVRNNEVSFYRPAINRDNNRNTAPRNFDRYNNRNGQDNGNAGRDNAGTGWRQNNPRNGDDNRNGQPNTNPGRDNNAGTGWRQNNPRNGDDNRNGQPNTNPGRDNNAGTGWRQNNPRNGDDNRNGQPNTNPGRDNNTGTGWRQNNPRNRDQQPTANPARDNNPGTGWRQNNPRNGDDNGRTRQQRDELDRQPVNRPPQDRVVERPSIPRTAPVERTERSQPRMENRQPERRPAFERPNNNNDMQRRNMNMERPARQSSPQMNREQTPARQMESRPMNRGGGEQRGGGRRRD